jgi:tetratricopeptide (TPR) repeat protein
MSSDRQSRSALYALLIVAQSAVMASAARALAVLMLLVVACAPAAALAQAEAEPTDVDSRRERAAERLRAHEALADDDSGAPYGLGGLWSGRSGWLSTLVLVAVFYVIFVRGRGAGASWGSYYLFWIGVPVLIALLSHPAVLIVVIVGLVARRWLPDPFLILKHHGRVRSLEVDVATNPGNATARRDLAKIWLEKHRPRRALPLLAEAIARDPDSLELTYLSGVSHLLAGEHEKALAELLAVIHREPGFHYGEAYLRAADALIALGRWDDADDALERFVKINSSSLEARYKQVRVCKARKDADGARKALADLRHVWRTLPAYQRRKQLGWYFRSLFV